MFGFKTKDNVGTPAPTQAMVALIEAPKVTVDYTRPEKLTKRPDEIPDMDKYTALARELKTGAYLRGNVLRRLVADFLWERGVEMYRFDDVQKYLKSRVAGETVTVNNTKEVISPFRWRPLRDCDGTEHWGWQHDLKEGGYFWSSRWECRTYDKVVPFDVLENVKALVKKFPKRLHFFVSDIEADPDPFILCTARDMAQIVFGAWDEPEFFRDGTQPK